MKDSGWPFDKITSMAIFFNKTRQINGSSYAKIPLRSSAILNSENKNNFCFSESNLAKLRPCESSHSNSTSNYNFQL